MTDKVHMRAAIGLARRGLGNTWPNPPVGCVIVREGRVVGRAVTAPGGRPHAETRALEMAGPLAHGATAYVSLEPCCHWGKTPPCTDALIAAGVARVVIGLRDPDLRVDGAGMAKLRAAGIEVVEGVMAAEAAEVVAGFVSVLRRERPLVTLKLATTLDGRIATRAGESRWITGEAARRMAHALRGSHDAVLVGAGTVRADDPDLTCRIPGYKPVPLVRVVADSHLRIGLRTRLVSTARETPTWIVHREGADPDRIEAFTALGVELIGVPAEEPGVDLRAALNALAERGITRLLVEGGGQIAAALLRADLVDRLAWFHAPSVMGGDGWPSAQGFGITQIAAMPRFERTDVTLLGADILTEFRRAA